MNEVQTALAIEDGRTSGLAVSPGSASSWRGVRVAFRMPEDNPEYRAIWKRHGDYWSFMWERGVVISEPKNGMVEVAVESHPRGIVRMKVHRLACHSCCGHGLVHRAKPGTKNPTELEAVQCVECARLPRHGLRRAHPRDEFGECNDTDPTGGWIARYKARIEETNEQIRRDWARKQNSQMRHEDRAAGQHTPEA